MKVREEVGQEVVGGMGSGCEAQAECAWRGWLGAWPGRLLLWDLKIPAGGPVESLLFLDGGQCLWEGRGMDLGEERQGFGDYTLVTDGSLAPQPHLLVRAGV